MDLSVKLPRKITLSIYLVALAGNIAWAVENQYYNIFLYNEIAPEPIYVSLIVIFSAIASTVGTIIMGAVSDVKGKRRPFMLYAFILWAFTTAMFPFAAFVRPVIMAVATAILFDMIMSYIGATAYDAAFNAYLYDVTTLENRGNATSIMEIMTLFSTLIIYGLSGFIIEAVGYYYFFIFIGLATGVIGVIGSFITEDSENLQSLDISVWQHLKNGFNFRIIKENKDCFMLLTAIGIWAIGFNIYFPFIMIYLEHHIGLDIIDASIVVFFALLVSIITGIPLGKLVDKIGRRKVAIYSVIFQSIFLILFAFAVDFIILIIFGILWVFFMSGWHISAQTWVKDLYPRNKAGQFSGFYLIFNVLIGMTCGSLIGGLIGENFGAPYVSPEGIPGFVPPPAIFIFAAIWILLAIPFVIKVKDLKKNE